MFLGLRTVVYKVGDLDKAKAWYTKILGFGPYFDESFYVGFNVGGYELGLDPDISEQKPGPGGYVAYWGVKDGAAAMKMLVAAGAQEQMALKDVGEGIKVGAVRDPFGNVFGVIENPHFKLPG